jgi:tetratricopeptide (TPR) repeat protein
MARHSKPFAFAAAHMRIASFAVGLVISAPAVFAQNWTDRSEYDLALAVRAEAAPAKRLQLIEQWKQKYPKTELQQVRAELQLWAYEAQGDIPKVLNVAREMVASNPRSFVGLYWLAILAPAAGDVSAEFLNQADAAAQRLLSEAPDFFSPDRKPQGRQGADWQKQRSRVELLAHRTLGWVKWQRGAYDGAEKEFRTALQIDPGQVEISSWLGLVLALQKTPDKQLQAIWHLARASSLDSDGSLTPVQQGETQSLLERVYGAYHGDLEGMDKIVAASSTSVMPPADFRIETAQEAAGRKFDEELSRTNPQLLAWLMIRRRLEQPDGQAHFETLIAAGLPRLKGYVIRHTPATRPTEIVIGLQDVNFAEIVLKLDRPLPGTAEPGTVIEFEAAPISFTAEPFMVYVQGEREKVVGWPSTGR